MGKNSKHSDSNGAIHIWIFRHAQRNSDEPDQTNPGISEKGQRQAEKIAEFFGELNLRHAPAFFASPLKRSQETLKPAAKNQRTELRIDDRLNERQPHESGKDFRKRVESWVLSAAKTAKTNNGLVVCSHLDWLEEVLTLIPSDEDLTRDRYHDWKTSQFLQFSIDFEKKGELWIHQDWRLP